MQASNKRVSNLVHIQFKVENEGGRLIDITCLSGLAEVIGIFLYNFSYILSLNYKK